MVFENLSSTGIVGISLIFIAIFMMVSAGSWVISWYAKSKKGPPSSKISLLKKNLHIKK
jgi:hypothetical protein